MDTEPLSLIHCADLHMDAPFASLKQNGDLPAKRRAGIMQTFKYMCKRAQSLKVRFVLISGDLYEETTVTPGTIRDFHYECAQAHPVQFVLIPGNHDPYHAGSYYHTFEFEKNVHILRPDRPFLYFKDQNTAFTYYDPKQKHITQADRTQYPDAYHILMLHGTIDTVCNEEAYATVRSQELEKAGYDYIAAGHFHNCFTAYGNKKTIYNPGSLEPLGFDEPGAHGFLAVHLKKNTGAVQIEATFCEVAQYRYDTMNLKVEPVHSALQIEDAVRARIEAFDEKQNKLIRVILEGRRAADVIPDVKRMEETIGQCAHLVILDETVPDYDLDAIAKEPGLRGEFVRMQLQKMEKANEPFEKDRTKKVIEMGLDALEGRAPVRTFETEG